MWVSCQTWILSILFFLLGQWNVCSVLWDESDIHRNRKLPDNFFTGVNVTVSLSSTSSAIWSNKFFNISNDSWHWNYFDISILIMSIVIWSHHLWLNNNRGGSRTAATSKIEGFVIIVNDWKLLTIISKHSILDVVVALDPPVQQPRFILNFLKAT